MEQNDRHTSPDNDPRPPDSHSVTNHENSTDVDLADQQMQAAPADAAYPLDQLLTELAEADAEEGSTVGTATAPDAAHDTAADGDADPHIRGDEPMDTSKNNLISSLRTLDEGLLVDAGVSAEVDFLLARTTPLTDAQLSALLAGADRGVQLAANRHRDLDQTLREFHQIIAAAHAKHLESTSLDTFEGLVQGLEDQRQVSFEDYTPDTVATWVRDLEVPWAPLLAALEPHQPAPAEHSDLATELVLRAADSEWSAYAHAVIELVDADHSLAASGQLGEEPVQGRHRENRGDEYDR